MRQFFIRRVFELRHSYWFLPSILTAVAVVLGYALPFLDARLGTDWMRAVGFLRPTEVEGARAILTTLAGATLGVAGVAFSITIVAVSFASANYGPRIIGDFMSDRTNQVVLGILVSTFVYCITVLSTVHAQREYAQETLQAFVPQISVLTALLLTLVSVGSLIVYIHHVPESINIMNLVAGIGEKLRRSLLRMIDEESRGENDRERAVGVAVWRAAPLPDADAVRVRTKMPGYLQHIDIGSLERIARERDLQIVIHRSPGDFLATGEMVISCPVANQTEDDLDSAIRPTFTLGPSRTDMQDVTFLSDQLVEVLARALSPGVNAPHTAILCLDWLRAGLSAFASHPPTQPAGPNDRVLYTRVTFEAVMSRSFRHMRQYIAADTLVTLHALGVLTDLALAATRQSMVDAVRFEIETLAASATELLQESVAREEVKAARVTALERVAAREVLEIGEGSARAA